MWVTSPVMGSNSTEQGTARMNHVSTLLVMSLACSAAVAAPDSELVRLAQLSVSAMQCSAYAADASDKERLLALGISAGRSYLVLASKEPESVKRVWAKIPGPYLQTQGASADFLVGRVYGIVEEEALRGELQSKQPASFFKFTAYRERNCALLR
jgi:hypothetical protein